MDGHVSETASLPGRGDFFHLSGCLLQVRARDLISSPANIFGCLTAKATRLTVRFLFAMQDELPLITYSVNSYCAALGHHHTDKCIPAQEGAAEVFGSTNSSQPVSSHHCHSGDMPPGRDEARFVYLRDHDAYSNKHLVSLKNSPSHKDGRTKRKV